MIVFKIVASRCWSRYLLHQFLIRSKVITFLIEGALFTTYFVSNLLHLRQSLRLHSVFVFHALTHQTHILQKWVLWNNLVLIKCGLSTTVHCLIANQWLGYIKTVLILAAARIISLDCTFVKKGHTVWLLRYYIIVVHAFIYFVILFD